MRHNLREASKTPMSPMFSDLALFNLHFLPWAGYYWICFCSSHFSLLFVNPYASEHLLRDHLGINWLTRCFDPTVGSRGVCVQTPSQKVLGMVHIRAPKENHVST